jgi:hypothetical protein
VGAGAVRRSEGKNYTSLNAATTGTVRPVHTIGSLYDGNAGVQWRFDDPGYGWAKITAIGGGGTTATVTVLSRIPDMAVLVGNASTKWAHGAWSNVEGWPTNVTFFRERLCFSRDRTVWESVSGDFENFRRKDDAGLVVADAAIVSDVTSDRANRIEWMAPFDVALLVGTAGDEHAISEITTNQAFGPGNAKARKQHEYGSRHVQPLRVGDDVVFVQKAGRKIRDMAWSWEKQGFTATDVTVLAEHVTKTGLIDMAYQQEPDSVVWGVREDGQLVGYTTNKEQDIRGWHPHRIGGYADAAKTAFAKIESVTCIPSPDGDRDELWMIVNRYINGAVRRYVEWQRAVHEEGDDPENAYHLDSSLTLDNTIAQTLTPGAGATVKGTAGVIFTAGAAVFAAGDVGKRIHYRYSTVDVKGKVTWRSAVADVTGFTDTTHVTGTIRVPWPNLTLIASGGWKLTVTSVTGLGHLEGETVGVWANGASHPSRTVVAGAITLNRPATKVHIGEDCHAVLQPMPIEAGAADGTAQGKTGRVSRCIIRFHETMGAKYGRDEDEQLDQILNRGGGDPMDEATPLFTGDAVVAWPSGYSGQALITVVADTPGPCTVIGLMPQYTGQDAR